MSICAQKYDDKIHFACLIRVLFIPKVIPFISFKKKERELAACHWSSMTTAEVKLSVDFARFSYITHHSVLKD
jgi:hypothetical protein